MEAAGCHAYVYRRMREGHGGGQLGAEADGLQHSPLISKHVRFPLTFSLKFPLKSSVWISDLRTRGLSYLRPECPLLLFRWTLIVLYPAS